MATLVLRNIKGSPLSNTEADNNFQYLNNALGANGSTTVPTPSGTGGPVLTNSPTITNLTYSGTLTGSNDVINIGSEQIYKDSSGNVGIGSIPTSNSLTLHSSKNLAWKWTPGNNYANIFNQEGSASLILANGYQRSSTANGFASSVPVLWGKSAIQVDYNGLMFYTDVSSTVAVGTDIIPTERMRIDATGNVGIGTQSPSERLTVVGNINASRFISTVATGTAPFTVSSSTNVANLNASSLNGATFASPSAIGSTVANTGAFTSLSASSTVSGTGFSNYLASPPAIGSTVANTGAFTSLSASSTVSGTGFSNYLASPPAIGSTVANTGAFTSLSASSTVFGSTVANTGAFTSLSASSTVSGTGFSNYLASPPAIGSTVANTGAFTNLTYSGTLTGSTNVINIGSGQIYKDVSGNVGIGSIPTSNSLTLDTYKNLAWKWTSGNNYANIFNQEGSASLILANGYQRSSTANGFASSVPVLWGKSAIRVDYNGLMFYADAASTVAVGTDIAPTERMRITPTGNVGIGTSSPSYNLDVNGSINATGAYYGTNAVKAFVTFNGTNGSIQSFHNVSSVTRYMAGMYGINFTTALSSANYAVAGTAMDNLSGTASDGPVVNLDSYWVSRTTTAFGIGVINGPGNSYVDSNYVTIIVV